MSDYDFDVFIIGGGINGCGIARDAVGRGYRVGLAEMNDLASQHHRRLQNYFMVAFVT